MDAASISRLGSQLEELSASTHLCVAYQSPDEQVEVAAPFLRIGLERRERCVYVDGGGRRTAMLAALEQAGVEVGPAVDSGALSTVPYPGPYLEQGTFDPDRMVRWLDQADVAARSQGFSGYRCIGEMTWALAPHPGVGRLAEYEAKVSAFVRERPMALMCQFDRQRFPAQIIREMIATHPVVIAGGNVCRNPYHVPAEKYLSPDWPASEIDWLLDSIGHLQRSEDALRASEERYRALSRQLLDVQERERRSLALELHDEIGQLLTAVRMTLQGAPRKGRLADAVKIADRAMEEVRHLAVALRPPGLDQGGLPAALRAYLEQLGQRTGIDIRLHVHGMTERLASEVETACFRVVQEALTNVVRHSGARHVDVELSADGGLAQLVVRDDGKGFDVRAARRRAALGASLGLVSMEERVTLVGGRLEIESERGRGTTIRARIPVPRAAA